MMVMMNVLDTMGLNNNKNNSNGMMKHVWRPICCPETQHYCGGSSSSGGTKHQDSYTVWNVFVFMTKYKPLYSNNRLPGKSSGRSTFLLGVVSPVKNLEVTRRRRM